MDFESAQKYLENFVSYEKSRNFAYDSKVFDLQRLKDFLGQYGVDLARFKYFHVGGSKGKGSVCRLVHDYLVVECGKVGLFTSPHVVSVCERIVVDGREISEVKFAVLVAELKDFLQRLGRDFSLTWFEILFVLALRHFSNCGCEYVVLEVGLGGRLDATNIVMPLISVLTSLEMEHADVLGDSLEKIFAEKWGIKKPGVPMVMNAQMKSFVDPIVIRAGEVFFAEANEDIAKLALVKAGFEIDEDLWKEVLKNFRVVGRYDVRVVDGKILVFDIAHTVKSFERLLKRVYDDFCSKKKVVIWGALKDKDIEGMRDIVEGQVLKGDRAVFVGGFSERAFDAEDYEKVFEKEFENLEKGELLVVTGSSYLVGKILKLLL